VVGVFISVVAWRFPQFSGKGFMQLGYVRFRNKRIIPGDRLSINVWIKNDGGAPVDNVYRFFEASLVPVGIDSDKTDRETHAKFVLLSIE
jgi:hypothetical protein